MADETRSAEVQLSADISAYQRPIGEATQQTNKLTDSVNKLVASLDGITKRAGKKLLIFSAADAAAMTAYTAAAAKYEKQLTTLRAQTELSGKSLSLYKKGIEDIARQMPISGAAVTALVTQINQLGITSERETIKMARTFTQLAAATGDDIGSLTQGMIELGRQMGTLGNGAQGMANFADSLTSVSNSAGVSATAVLSFSQAIAPMARAAGIGQKEVLGISTAFTKAGADGFAAANTFNSMVTDITRQVMSGSPEIAKYAAAVGATVEQFKQMDATERIVQIFEAVTKAGPDAVKLIDRLGYDGIRAAKSIQAVANESGGLRKAIEESIGAYGSGSTQRGAEAAFSSMDAAMTRFRNNLEQIAATIGSSLLPVATAFMNVLNKGLEAVNQMAGPLLQIAGAMTGILAPLSAAFGGMMTMMGPLSTLMLAMTAFRLSPLRAMIQGVKEGSAARTAATYKLPYVPTTEAGRRMAPGGQGMPIFRSAPYRWGEALGGRLPVGTPGVPSSAGQMLLRGGIGAAGMVNTWYIDPTKQMIANAAMADPFNRKSVTGDMIDRAWRSRDRFGSAVSEGWRNPYGYLMSRGGPIAPPPMAGGGAMTMNQMAKIEAEARAENALRTDRSGNAQTAYARAATEYKSTMEAYNKAAKEAAASSNAVAKANGTQVRTVGQLGAAMAATARNAAGLPLAYTRMGAGLAAQGIGRVGGGLLGSLGGMVGGGAGTGAAIAGIAAVGYGIYKTREGTERNIINEESQSNLSRINVAIGQAAESLGDFAKKVEESTQATKDLKTASDGFAMSLSERSAAISGEYADERIKNLSEPEAAIAFLKTMGEINGEQARALAKDLAKSMGAQTSKFVTDTYLAETKGIDFNKMSFAGIGEDLFASAAGSTDQGVVGGLRNFGKNLGWNGLFGVDDATTEQVQAAFMGAREQAYRVGQRYGEEAQAVTQAATATELLGAAFALPDSAGGMTTKEQAVKQWEAIYGEMGLDTGSAGIRTAYFGENLNTNEDFLRWVFNPENTSEGGRNFRESLIPAGLGASDFIGPRALDPNELAIRMQRGNMSDYERQVRSTELGEFARTSEAILAVTEGRSVEDPQAVGTAVMGLYDKMISLSGGFENVTAAANKLAKDAGSASDPLYQLAMAAKGLAVSRGLTQATQQAGMVGSFQFRLNQNAQEMENAVSDTDRIRLEQERDALEQEGYSAAVAYESALYEFQKSTLRSREDFHQQMVWSEEDFGRNMKRAAEDAAKNMMNPYARLQSTYVTSSDTVVSNSREQLQMLKNIPKNLAKLREMGVSQAVIDTLNLTDPAMYQQLQGFVDEGTGLNVKGLNKYAGKARVNASLDIVSEQQVTRRGIEDFQRGQERAEFNFEKQIARSLKDLKDYGREVYGDFDDIMDKIQKRMNKVMPGVESPFYKKLVEIGDAIVGRESLDTETTRAKNKAAVNVNVETAESTVYDMSLAAPTSYYQAGRGTTSMRPDSIFAPRDLNTPPAQGPNTPRPRQPEGTAPRVVIPTPHNAAGGVVKGLTLSVLGELARPEMIVPLQGPEAKEYITSMAAQITTHMVKGLHTSGKGSPTVYKGSNVTITNHTEFRDIKVVAQDPNEMARKLKEKERMENMRRGANAKA